MANTRDRLALFVGQADEYFQSRFIKGFTERAFEKDMDVCVFSMYRKYQDTQEREWGDSNILRLANPKYFTGIIILKDTIQTAGAVRLLEDRLHQIYDGPVLVIDADSDYFPSQFIDGYRSVRMITKHLIEKHNLKDIAFLSGKKWHRHSQERQSGFEDEMKEHGLEVPEYRIIQGDFWYKSGERCVDYLSASERKLPEAIVCANDQMAIGVCKAFEQRGIRVPEDIIVVGSDSSMEGQMSPKSITSYLTPANEFGQYAVDWILEKKSGKEPAAFVAESRLMAGESCGCCDPEMPDFSLKRNIWDTEISREGYESVNNTMFENLMIQNDINDYISMVYSYAYQIEDAASFHLCLSNSVKYLAHAEATFSSRTGYPEKMIYAVRYNESRTSNIAGTDEYFETEKMLPDLFDSHNIPTSYFFTPVFFEDMNFGYAVVSFNHPGAYNEKYRRWIGTVSRGFESLRRNLLITEQQVRLNKLKTGKFEKTTVAYENLSEEEKKDYDTVKEILDNNLLTYHFQPIVSAKDGMIFSYEALMRSKTERRISPLAIIKYASMMGRLADVESATFINVLDILDNDTKYNEAKVFINSIPGVKVKNVDTIAGRLSEKSDTVVVELTEEAQLEGEELLSFQEFYRRLNIELAIDDYGTGYSNISNLINYMPDYVKIDRSLLSDIQNRPQKQHFVREIIEFCHDNNIKALAEGVETSEELRMVIHLGADLIQGYYTAKPAPGFLEKINEDVIEEIKLYQQEKQDGKFKATYIAGKTNRISLLSLAKDEITDIVIGQGEMVYKDLTIVGTPSFKSDINVRIEHGYTGRITLENVYFSNVKDRPCISIGEEADVICIIEGDNTFKGSGVRVPESSRFTLEGNGNLSIFPNHSEIYGIGNDLMSRHGELVIDLTGKLLIDSRSTAGVLIGSGKGGKITIKAGSIALKANGDTCVGIGSVFGNDEIKILNCGMEVDFSVSDGVANGSMNGPANVKIHKCYIRYTINGNHIAVLGTLRGAEANINILDSFVEFYAGGADSTCIGALNGNSNLKFAIASLRIENAGEKALAFGGSKGETIADFNEVDTKVRIHNSSGVETYAKDENITMTNGKCSIMVNDVEIERKLVYKYDKH
ncbi:MAG: EAL domain-containing protein [Lachnospiraceae bacterium]|nr:EAL domain-containing protein [Lachnospiraceae bacterium]